MADDPDRNAEEQTGARSDKDGCGGDPGSMSGGRVRAGAADDKRR